VLLSGEHEIESIRSYPGVQRTFCSKRGSTLQFVAE
jgi:hypothetical protein